MQGLTFETGHLLPTQSLLDQRHSDLSRCGLAELKLSPTPTNLTALSFARTPRMFPWVSLPLILGHLQHLDFRNAAIFCRQAVTAQYVCGTPCVFRSTVTVEAKLEEDRCVVYAVQAQHGTASWRDNLILYIQLQQVTASGPLEVEFASDVYLLLNS